MNDYITKDILKCLKVPPATKCRVERKMTEEEVYGILKKARGKVKLLVQCLFFLGLRVSEALSLKKKDVIYGPRLSFSVMRKGQKRREVLTGRMVSKKIWHQIFKMVGTETF